MKWFVLVIGLGLVIGVFLLLSFGSNYYNGKMTFSTEQEYTQFKIALSNPAVSYEPTDLSVLSSAPPIIVSFSGIAVSQDATFPYGHDTSSRVYTSVGLIVVGGLFFVFSLLQFIFVQKQPEGK